MNLKKPLLFIYPLSPSLQKYLEFAKNSAEEEGFEVYELDILGEALQLIPTVGSSLVLGSSPKKMAQVLQATRKSLQHDSSKVLLLTDKALPIKLVQKLQKIGLTEYLQEPVNPKTLIYKVGLLLKSLPTDTHTESEEKEDVVFSAEDVIDVQEKQRIEKGILSEEADGEPTLNEQETIELHLIASKAHHEPIDKLHFEEPVNKNEVREELTINPVKYNGQDESNENEEDEQNISTYYKSYDQASTDLDLETDESIAHDKTNDQISDNEIQKIKDEMALSELDISSASTPLTLIGEGEGPGLDSVPQTELNLNISEGSNDGENNTEISLHSAVNKSDEKESLESEEVIKRLREQDELELSLEKAKKELDTQIQFDALSAKKKTENQEEVGHQQLMIDEINAIDLDIESNKRDETTLQIESEIEKALSSQEKDEEQKLMVKERDELKLTMADTGDDLGELELSNSSSTKKAKAASSSDQLDNKKLAESDKLTLLASAVEIDNAEQEQEEDLSQLVGESEKLKLDQQNIESEVSSLEISGGTKKQKASTTLLVDAKGSKTSNHNEQQESDSQTLSDYDDSLILSSADSKKAPNAELILEKNANKKTEQDSVNYDWENPQRKSKEVEDGLWISKKKRGVEIVFEKERSGEETIDYRKLKKAFENVSLNDKIDKKAQRDLFKDQFKGHDDSSTKEKFDDLFGSSSEADATEEDGQFSEKTLFIPETNGLQHLIKVLLMYLDKRSEKHIFLYICNTLYREHKAYGGFFAKSNIQAVSFDELFASSEQIEYDGDRQDFIKNWDEKKNTSRLTWQSARLPSWDDETFQAKLNGFTYPFYEGLDQLGFAYFVFPDGIDQKQSSQLEMLIEGARGIYLEKLKKEDKKHPNGAKTEQAEAKSKEGIFGRFFKGRGAK